MGIHELKKKKNQLVYILSFEKKCVYFNLVGINKQSS